MKIFGNDANPNNPLGGRGSFEQRRPTTLLWLLVVVLAAFFGWAANAEIDQITRAPGQVIPSSRVQVIQSLDGGVIQEIMVKQGDEVTKGQLLVRLDRTKLEAAYREAEAKVAGVSATLERLKAEAFGGNVQFGRESVQFPDFRTNQRLLFEKRRTAHTAEIANLKGMLALAQQELSMTEPLMGSGDVSLADVLKLRRTVADLEAQITNKRNQFMRDVQTDLSKAEEDLTAAEQTLTQRRDQLQRTELFSPMNGVVKKINFTTVGGVARPAEEFMQIVPIEDDLLIEAKVKPSDIAFLKPGLYANVKIDSYDYTIYGTLKGTLTYISADTLAEESRQGTDAQPYYRVQVQTQGKRFSARPNDNLEIQPGMTATVEIKTGKNTVLRYLIKPAIKTISESLGER